MTSTPIIKVDGKKMVVSIVWPQEMLDPCITDADFTGGGGVGAMVYFQSHVKMTSFMEDVLRQEKKPSANKAGSLLRIVLPLKVKEQYRVR